jgi:hypothetical protein
MDAGALDKAAIRELARVPAQKGGTMHTSISYMKSVDAVAHAMGSNNPEP